MLNSSLIHLEIDKSIYLSSVFNTVHILRFLIALSWLDLFLFLSYLQFISLSLSLWHLFLSIFCSNSFLSIFPLSFGLPLYLPIFLFLSFVPFPVLSLALSQSFARSMFRLIFLTLSLYHTHFLR